MLIYHYAKVSEFIRLKSNGTCNSVADYLPDHRWVRIRRSDVVGQAVSLAIARTSGSWHHKPAEKELKYDFFLLLTSLMIVLHSEFAWDKFFESNPDQPYQIIYEDFFFNSDIKHNMAELLDFLNIPYNGPGISVESNLPILRNEVNKYWSERFSEELLKFEAPEFNAAIGPDLRRWTDFFYGYGWREPQPIVTKPNKSRSGISRFFRTFARSDQAG